jgi:hypothetical protein
MAQSKSSSVKVSFFIEYYGFWENEMIDIENFLEKKVAFAVKFCSAVNCFLD